MIIYDKPPLKIFLRSRPRLIITWQPFNWTGKRVLFKRVWIGFVEVRRFG